MQYQGGKARQAKRLVGRIAELSAHRTIIEPFCGGCSMTAEFARQGFQVKASDAHAALISMWSAALDGWRAPCEATAEQHKAACNLPDSDPLKAFFEFGCSFGGKSWGGFADFDKRNNITYAAAAHRSIEKKASAMRGNVTFERRSFFDISPDRAPCVLYCDPPYAGTAGYRGERFDSERFWSRCQEWAAAGHDVFVSEYKAPDWAESVLALHRAQGMRLSRGAGTQVDQERTEHLYRIRRFG